MMVNRSPQGRARKRQGPIRVMVVDDHPLMIEALEEWLSGDPDFEVVGHAEDGEELFRKLAAKHVDVVVLDLHLPGKSGLEICQALSSKYPAVHVVAFTGYPEESTLLAALEAGARGFVLKRSEASLIRQAIRAVAAGGRFIDPRVADRVVGLALGRTSTKAAYGLTRQERRVLSLFPKGMSSAEMAESLGIGVPTVKTHIRKILRKLQVKDRAQAAAKAAKEGLL